MDGAGPVAQDGRMPIQSVAGVADVEELGRGEGPIDLLVEVPHGADRRAHYDALRARLRGELPAHLEEFFFVNTDVGAWQLGRRVAERVAAGGRRVVVIRSLVPRTFIDCNRIEDATAEAGMTASVPAYVRDAGDRALLLDLHRRYVGLVETAVASSGFVFMPHTYGPRTLGIEKIDEMIVEKLRWAHQPGIYESWPVRPEVDFITRTADGTLHAAASVVDAVGAAYRALGLEVAENKTYAMHPSTQGLRWALRCPERTFCLEMRRDLLCPGWIWNQENEVSPSAANRFAEPIAEAFLTRARTG